MDEPGLGTLGGSSATPNDINDAGHIVGESSPPGGGDHAFLWTPSGGMVDLGTLGGSFSVARPSTTRGRWSVQ